MATEEQNDWVQRVLGVAPLGPTAGPIDLAKAAAGWRAASDAIDQQISALQRVLKADGDSELAEIAEFGLNAITGGFKVKMMAALMEAERGNAKARETLAGLANGFRTHLESDERVEACDDNPFGVAMSIRATLLPALDDLARSVSA